MTAFFLFLHPHKRPKLFIICKDTKFQSNSQLGINTKNHFFKVRNMLRLAWSNGFVQLKECNNINACEYVVKYMKKGSSVPPHQNDTFVLSSRGNGGFGYPFFRTLLPYIQAHPHQLTYKFLDKFTGKNIEFRLNKYLLDKAFPSEARQIPLEYRNSLKRLSYNNSKLVHLGIIDINDFNSKVNEYVHYLSSGAMALLRYIQSNAFRHDCNWKSLIKNCRRSSTVDISWDQIAQDEETCKKYRSKVYRRDEIDEITAKRNIYLTQMMSKPKTDKTIISSWIHVVYHLLRYKISKQFTTSF